MPTVMAPAAVADNLRLWVTALGGMPAGNENRLVVDSRKRLDEKFQNFEEPKNAVKCYLYGTHLLVQYLQASVPKARFAAFSTKLLAEHIFEGFKIIGSRTRLLKRHRGVTEDDDAWALVEAGLQLLAEGKTVAPPEKEDGDLAPSEWRPALTVAPPWWSHRRAIGAFIALLAALVFQCRGFLETGRHRFYISIVSLLILWSGGLWVWYGPKRLPGWILSVAEENDGDSENDDDALSEASTFPDVQDSPERRASSGAAAGGADDWSAPTAEEDRAISSMKEGMAEMKKMTKGLAASPTRPQHLPDTGAGVFPSPPTETTPIPPAMQALANFTQNATPEGPTSLTAQRMLAEQNAGGNVAASPPVTMPVWAAKLKANSGHSIPWDLGIILYELTSELT